jgi:hypothetical protein
MLSTLLMLCRTPKKSQPPKHAAIATIVCRGAHADPNLDGEEAQGAGSVGGDAATWVGSVGVCRGSDLLVSWRWWLGCALVAGRHAGRDLPASMRCHPFRQQPASSSSSPSTGCQPS